MPSWKEFEEEIVRPALLLFFGLMLVAGLLFN